MNTSEGWVGGWSPGIGDPSWAGWLTVGLYFAAAFAAFRLLRRHSFALEERWFWRVLGVVLLALGVNKQLDLQTAFTELGRVVAREQGWYDVRGGVQRVFIAGMALLSIATTVALAAVLRRVPAATKLSLVGAACLLLFVVVRASSFHHVDSFLGTSTFGLRWNWVLEIGGLLIIGLGMKGRQATTAPRSARVLGGRIPRNVR